MNRVNPPSQRDTVEEAAFVDKLADLAVRTFHDCYLQPERLRTYLTQVVRCTEGRDTTPHYRRVRAFMVALQRGRNAFRVANGMPTVPQLPERPTDPGPALRLLRARLILEEALETVRALGFTLRQDDGTDLIDIGNTQFVDDSPFDIVGVADGCADVSVVAIGTLVECGLRDAPVLRLVDENNASKNGPGSQFVGDKLMKPPGFKPPDIAGEVARQSLP